MIRLENLYENYIEGKSYIEKGLIKSRWIEGETLISLIDGNEMKLKIKVSFSLSQTKPNRTKQNDDN